MTFSDQNLEGSDKIIATTKTAMYPEDQEVFDKPYTLEPFSIDHFLPPSKRTLSKTLQTQVRKKDKNTPWAFSKVFLLDIDSSSELLLLEQTREFVSLKKKLK